ncbi:MAG: homoserine kinase [Nocardioidaceae bacterium]
MAVVHDAPVRVRVPATSANVGPGYDSFGLALAKHDVVCAEVTGDRLVVDVTGEGADDVPRDRTHLVVSSLLAGLDAWADERPDGLRLDCVNRLPHGRGLGSSAAAIVAGLTTARALLDGVDVGDADLLDLASRLEGHPDNVAACLLGGFTVSWTAVDGRAHGVRLQPHRDVHPVVCVPGWPMSTEQARGLIPAQVSHADAAFNVARSALLVTALTQRPDLLLEATQDRLHQPYRAASMRPTADVVQRLRAEGVAAVVSGAGPSVLALPAGDEDPADAVRRVAGDDWSVEYLPIDLDGARVLTASE